MNIRLIIIVFLSILIGKSFAQSKWEISVSSGTSSSKFLAESPLGYSIEGSVFYRLTDSLRLSISSGFNRWYEELGFDNNKLSSISILTGIKYSLPLRLFSPYLSGEAGVHIITRDFVFQDYKPSEQFEGLYSLVSSEHKTESVTKFAYRVGIGSNISIFDKLALDLGIRYSVILYDFMYIFYPTNQRSSGITDFYSLVAGFNYK